jgi:hypothetical protein
MRREKWHSAKLIEAAILALRANEAPMEAEPLVQLARRLMDELTFCVAVTQGEDGEVNARVVQPLPGAVHDVMPEPKGYSAPLPLRSGPDWLCSATYPSSVRVDKV